MTEQDARNMLTALVEASNQKKVATSFGLHYNTINRWLHGKQTIPLSRRKMIWRVYRELLIVTASQSPCPGTSSADPQAEPSAGPPSPFAARSVPKRDRTT